MEFLANFTQQQLLAVAALVAAVAWYAFQNRAEILPALAKALPKREPLEPSAPVAPAVNDDHLDADAFQRLRRRFERLKCAEGQKALDQVGRHFFACDESQEPHE